MQVPAWGPFQYERNIKKQAAYISCLCRERENLLSRQIGYLENSLMNNTNTKRCNEIIEARIKVIDTEVAKFIR